MEKEQNNDEINQIIDKVSSSCSSLELDVKEKIPCSFQVLIDLGLLRNSLIKLEQQANDLILSYKSIENQLMPYKKNIDKKQKVNVEALMEAIPKFDINTLNNLIEFLNDNKDTDTKLIDLLLNVNKAEELFILLRKVFGEEEILQNISFYEYKNVQRKLCDAIMKPEFISQELNNNSILIAKDYLIELSKNNKIDPSDLLLDREYRKYLKESLQTLYKKNTSNKFNEYIDKVAKDNQMTAAELLSNNFMLLL